MLTPHRFPPDKKNWVEKRGRYNAGAIFLKNNQAVHNCLKWWREECLKWCYHRHEPGRLGDQKYLDQWQDRFPGVYDTVLPGVNLGPWSLPQYKIETKNNKIFVNSSPLILFHFHGLKIYSGKKIKFNKGEYSLSPQTEKIIYQTYTDELIKVINLTKSVDNTFRYGFIKPPGLFMKIKKQLKNIYE